VLGAAVTPVIPNQVPWIRNNPVYNIYDKLSWVKGRHTINSFNHPVLNVGTTNIDATSFGQTTGARVGPRNIQIRARLDW
jgi:hypothetical protein